MFVCSQKIFWERRKTFNLFSFSRGLKSLEVLTACVETQNGECHSLQLCELTPEDKPGRPSYKTKSCHFLVTGSLAVNTTVTARFHH